MQACWRTTTPKERLNRQQKEKINTLEINRPFKQRDRIFAQIKIY